MNCTARMRFFIAVDMPRDPSPLFSRDSQQKCRWPDRKRRHSRMGDV